MKYFIITLLFFGFSASVFASETEFIISGPLFGLRSPIENPVPYYMPDAELLNCYGGAFSTDIGPVFVDGALFYSSGGVIGFNQCRDTPYSLRAKSGPDSVG